MARILLRASVVLVSALAATWLSEGAVAACPAVYPAPASCSVDARTAVAAVGTWTISGLFALVVAVVALRPPRIVRTSASALFVAASAVVPVWTLLSTGFAADTRVLLVALLVLVVLALGPALVAAPRADGRRGTGR
ncbi:hypothetical protein Q7F20_05465 [Curtobacterium sp. A7_M15]|uniref:hypothetical protein n=1 Tax=Curtobacterium sp. A7_M15 TaxID=3065241 RepID=UPI002737B33B|nr:hypothetical protein [Curtobacterium sp. A7_M15]MDP4332811.1 hypothetical protein [Curtobacterium sp. A7_M15]